MYVIFIILFSNYEKAVHVPNYRFFWKGLCFNYLISTLSSLHMHENFSQAQQILNTPLLTIVTKKNSISDIAVVLNTSLEQVPLTALL